MLEFIPLKTLVQKMLLVTCSRMCTSLVIVCEFGKIPSLSLIAYYSTVFGATASSLFGVAGGGGPREVTYVGGEQDRCGPEHRRHGGRSGSRPAHKPGKKADCLGPREEKVPKW